MELPCRTLLLAGALIYLSGCAVGPDYDPPAVAVPPTFRTASLTPAVEHAPPIPDFVRWWRVLHDPQLDRLIDMAIAGNPDIEIALTRVQEARSQQIVVLGGMLPTVAGSGTSAAGTGVNVTAGRVDWAIAAGADARGFRQIDRMAGFDASWEIDLFGKVRRSLEAARDDAEARMELRNAVLITVIAEVARNYLTIRALQMRLEIVRKHIATAQRTVDEAMTRLQRGTSNESEPKQESKSSKKESKSSASNEQDRASAKPADQEQKRAKQADKTALSNESILAQAKSNLALLQARPPEIAAEISAARSRLARLLGAYAADVDGAIQGPAGLPALPERLRPGVPVELLRRRPDVRAAERELAAATERIGVATAMLFPSVALTAGFGAQGATGAPDGVGVVPQINGPIWSFGPRAYWPLLDFGRLDALINIEEMRTHEALVRYKRIIIAAVEDVDQAIVQHHLNLQRRKALGAARDEIHREVVIFKERYRRGETELTALFDVQRRYYATADRAAMAAEDAVLGYVAFYKALGGGWELYDELPPIPPAQPAIAAAINRLTAGWHWH